MDASAYEEFRDLEAGHWWFIGRRRIFIELLRRSFRSGAANTRRALDLGCGMGGMLGPVSEFCDVYGVDISNEALAWCRDRGYSKVFLGKGNHLPLPDHSLDLVTAFDTIEHIPEEAAALSECYRVLKPGGRIIISVPAYQCLYSHQDRVVHHQRRYTLQGLSKKLRAAGFGIERTSYNNIFLFPIILPAVLLIKLKERLFPPEGSGKTNVSFPIPRWVNRVLAEIFSFERHLVPHLTIPAGHSLIAVARRP